MHKKSQLWESGLTQIIKPGRNYAYTKSHNFLTTDRQWMDETGENNACTKSPNFPLTDEEQAEDDIAVNNDGVTLLVDPLSFQYLMGAEVDYSESLQGAQFVIRNPNASTTCGCGSSFSV